jgi:hypothetical protein
VIPLPTSWRRRAAHPRSTPTARWSRPSGWRRRARRGSPEREAIREPLREDVGARPIAARELLPVDPLRRMPFALLALGRRRDFARRLHAGRQRREWCDRRRRAHSQVTLNRLRAEIDGQHR